MPITLVTGPANAGKAQVVMDAVRRHLAHGEEPLLVLPTRADAEHYLRELAGAGTALGARVERFEGLISEAVARAGVAETVLGAHARERVLMAVAEREGAGEATAGFGRALGEAISELQVRRVTPARLGEAFARLPATDRSGGPSADLGRLYAAYHRALREAGCLDSDQRALRALDALRRRPPLWGGRPVLIYGFDDLTRLQLDAIETLGTVVGAEVTVSLAYEPGRTAFAGRAATFQALLPLAAEHRSLPAHADYYAADSREALAHLERSLFEPDAPRVDAGQAVRLLEGGGERAELELVAHEIGTLLAEGMAPEEIAVAIRVPAARAALLEEVFAAAAVPVALQRPRPFRDSAIGRALIGLLRCVPDGGPADGPVGAGAGSAERGRRGAGAAAGEARDLLAWLRAPGLLQRPELADRLELSARRAGIHSAAGARALWEQRNWRLETIDHLAAAAARGPAALIDRVARELQWLFCAPRRASASVLADVEVEEAHALRAARRALAELRELARAAPGLAPDGPAALAAALERVEFTGGERPAPGAVAVLDPLALRARRVRALFVCGLQEGVFPAPARPRPFLGDEERRRLALAGGLALGEQPDALAAERYLLYAAISRPEEYLYLSWHLADDDGEPTVRSLFVDDICDLFDDSLQERRGRRELGAVGQPGDPPRPPAGAVAEGLAPLRDEQLLEQLRSRPWSASSLQAWISCPARWFIERMLAPNDFDPEAEPLARGALAHAALRDTLEGLARDTGSARLTPAKLGLARELLAAALEANEAERPLTVAPERLPAARRRLHADLERYLEYAATLASPLAPLHLELGFGFAPGEDAGERAGGTSGPAEQPLPAFELGPGVRLRGRIDRIDVGSEGEAIVYDYKNRNAPAPGKWIAEGNLQVALYMRAAEELLGVRAVGGFYQPLAGEDLRPRGLLDGDAGLELDCVRGDTREREEVRELLDQAVATALAAAAEAGHGSFEPRPQTCGWNGSGCQYPTICRCER
jgi:ATP-dependent helicase/DNAse subunit B